MGTRWRFPRAVWLAWVLVIGAAACQPQAEDKYATAQALTAALRQAGATVEATAIAAPPEFSAGAAWTLQVNQGLVYVYEYAGAEEAQAVAATPGAQWPQPVGDAAAVGRTRVGLARG